MTARHDFTPAAKWPHIGCPTEPGPLTEAELDARIRETYGPDLDALSIKAWPLPQLDGPYRLTLWQRVVRFLRHAWHG